MLTFQPPHPSRRRTKVAYYEMPFVIHGEHVPADDGDSDEFDLPRADAAALAHALGASSHNLTSGAGLYDTPTRAATRHPQAHYRPCARRFQQASSLEARIAPHLRGVVYPSGRAYEASPSKHRSHLRGVTATPSYVAFTDSERLVGDAAKNQVAMNPHNTVFDARRLIARKFSEPEVQADMKHFPFKIINKAGKPYI
ncbi:Hsp70 protein-domain-containing protein [Schizophyllum commune]